jgi:uncharacterized protein
VLRWSRLSEFRGGVAQLWAFGYWVSQRDGESHIQPVENQGLRTSIMNLVSKDYNVFPITRMWASLETSGLERFQLMQAGNNWRLQGTMLRVHASQAIEARYLIECNSSWETVKAEIEVHTQTETRTLLLENRNGSWAVNGEATSDFDGCKDVDLGWTPSTNTLPIRRLDLVASNKRGLTDAVWISFPELSLERLPQSYEPLGNRTYRFESGAGGFTAEITVDQHGIVHEYKGHWKRVF